MMNVLDALEHQLRLVIGFFIMIMIPKITKRCLSQMQDNKINISKNQIGNE